MPEVDSYLGALTDASITAMQQQMTALQLHAADIQTQIAAMLLQMQQVNNLSSYSATVIDQKLALKGDKVLVDQKAFISDLEQRAPATRTIAVSGLLQGGGSLAADRTISLPVATQAEAEAGTDDTRAMTPLRVAEAIIARSASNVKASCAGKVTWSGTVPTITYLRSQNIQSITIDYSTAVATVTFQSSFPSNNYVVLGSVSSGVYDSEYGGWVGTGTQAIGEALASGGSAAQPTLAGKTTSSVKLRFSNQPFFFSFVVIP
jgi:uncharacterized membrane protein YfbV (UPF0208 family)